MFHIQKKALTHIAKEGPVALHFISLSQHNIVNLFFDNWVLLGPSRGAVAEPLLFLGLLN